MVKVLVYIALPPHLQGHPDVWQMQTRPGERPLTAYLREQLPATLKEKIDLVIVENADQALREIGDAEVFFGWMTPGLLDNARKLRWVQSTNASQENHLFPGFVNSKVVVTSVAGIYNDVIADHVYGLILGLTRYIAGFARHQDCQRWAARSEYKVDYLSGKTLGVIGLGSIGGEVAKRGPAFGMRVVATRAHPEHPKPDYVDQVWGQEGLDDLLQQSDFVVNCTPETPSTKRMIGKRELALMKPNSYIFNIGRGSAIDLEVLTEALESGAIAGAGLDCFEIEPLPPGHPLWSMENVLITPHMAGAPTPNYRRVDVFLENLSRYLEGRPLKNIVDKVAGH